MGIQHNLDKFLNDIPQEIKLVAVSKTKPVEIILDAYNAGQRIFGENKVQELITKQALLPKNIEWHFIGHLQRNKVKYIAPFVALIHAVDSLRLLSEINKQGFKNKRVLQCLLQFHIASESSKYGLSFSEAAELLQSDQYNSFEHVEIVGVMGMATFTENVSQIRQEFKTLKKYFNQLKSDFFSDLPAFKEISMGMSDDYQIAIEEGSTIIRVGTKIFGTR